MEASPRKSIRVQNTPQKVDRSTTASPRKAVHAPATPSRVLPEDSPRKSNRILNTPQKVDQTSAASPRQAVQSSSTPTRVQPRRSETPRKALKEQQLKADTPPAKQSKTHTKTVQHRGVDGSNRTPTKNVYSVPKVRFTKLYAQQLMCFMCKGSGGWAVRESGYKSEGCWLVPNEVVWLARHFTLLALGECPCTCCKSLWIRASAKFTCKCFSRVSHTGHSEAYLWIPLFDSQHIDHSGWPRLPLCWYQLLDGYPLGSRCCLID